MVMCLLLEVGRFLFGAIWKLSGGMGVSGDSSALWGYIICIFSFRGGFYFLKLFHRQLIGHSHIYRERERESEREKEL